MNSTKIKNIVVGTKFDRIEDALAADIVSGIPVIGAVSDFFRLLDSESRPQKALQALDMIASPLPVIDIFTPTNTLIYLDEKGFLPVKLDKIEELSEKIKMLPLPKRK